MRPGATSKRTHATPAGLGTCDIIPMDVGLEGAVCERATALASFQGSPTTALAHQKYCLPLVVKAWSCMNSTSAYPVACTMLDQYIEQCGDPPVKRLFLKDVLIAFYNRPATKTLMHQ